MSNDVYLGAIIVLGISLLLYPTQILPGLAILGGIGTTIILGCYILKYFVKGVFNLETFFYYATTKYLIGSVLFVAFSFFGIGLIIISI